MCAGKDTHTHRHTQTEKDSRLIILYLYTDDHIHTLHQQSTSEQTAAADKTAAVTTKNQNDVMLMNRH